MSAEPVLTAETVRALPAELKRQLFALLARELVGPSGTTSVADGEVTVYAVPANARALAERAMREATPERLAELQRRAATPENSFSVEELLGEPNDPADQTR